MHETRIIDDPCIINVTEANLDQLSKGHVHSSLMDDFGDLDDDEANSIPFTRALSTW
jgi:hypothetical protein